MRHPRRSSTSWWATTVLSCATSSGGWATALSPRRSSRRLSFAAWSAATTIRDSVVGWFYRVLRNAVIDHQRRQGVANRKLDAFAIELQSTKAGDEELTNVVCACVSQLAGTLKPEYADALRRIEIDQVSVKAYAKSVGISASNAGVRIFRAREALRKQVARSCGTCAEHGCLDCTCDAPCSEP